MLHFDYSAYARDYMAVDVIKLIGENNTFPSDNWTCDTEYVEVSSNACEQCNISLRYYGLRWGKLDNTSN